MHMNTLKRLSTGGLLLLALPLLSGCAAMSLFVPYPEQMQPQLAQLDQGVTPALLEGSLGSGPDSLLHLLERARMAQILGLHEVSQSYFAQAIERFSADENGAFIRLSDIGSQGAALLSNDNVLPYRGAAYERIFVHLYQALNYLFLKDLSAAAVEARRADAAQSAALKAHDRELLSLQAQARALPVSLDSAGAQFAAMDKVAAQVKHSFQNAYAYYVSGLIFEHLGELNDAYVDYQNALELAPQHPLLQAQVRHLAERLGDTARWAHLPEPPPSEPDTQPLVILYENGFVPAKSEASISFPLGHGLLTIAFPVYRFFPLSGALSVRLDGGAAYRTQPVLNVQSLVARALTEQRLGLFVRQAGRAVTKAQLQRVSHKEGGAVGELLAGMYSLLTENADLRSWLSLPNRVDVLHLSVPMGAHQLMVQDTYQGRAYPVQLNIRRNSLTLLHIINSGRRLYTHSVSLTP